MQAPFQLSQADARPMYAQIMDKIKQLIIGGHWVAGQAMPSIRELAVALGVSVITVKRAYQELEREGVILMRHGMGSFVAEQTNIASAQKYQELQQHLQRAIDLAQLLALSPEELKTLLDNLLSTNTHSTRGKK